MCPVASIPADAIVTYTGKIIRPLDPDPEQIDIEDIAHSLSNQCRFTGHTSSFYSTAQHSWLIAEYLEDMGMSKEIILWGLLHDATEAYISDIARPVKNAGDFGEVYRYAEMGLMDAVCKRFGLDRVFPEAVKHADDVLLRTEMRDLMPSFVLPSLGWENEEMLEKEIYPHSPGAARVFFMSCFRRLT